MIGEECVVGWMGWGVIGWEYEYGGVGWGDGGLLRVMTVSSW